MPTCPQETRDDEHVTAPTTFLTGRFARAVDMARTLHATDVRKASGIPYVAHLLAVAAIVLEHGGSEDQAIAALLHDAAEDHGGAPRIEAIRAEFGDAVAAIVEACSDSLVEDASSKRPWWDRKIDYLDHLATTPDQAALVSAADKLHNARSILADYRALGDELWSRFNPDAGREGSLWYYDRLAQVLGSRLTSAAGVALAKELRRTVDEIQTVATHNGHDVTDALARSNERESAVRLNAGFSDADSTGDGIDAVARAEALLDEH
jgi:(p)ppGpp synthase/HD superfamily hydrolase